MKRTSAMASVAIVGLLGLKVWRDLRLAGAKGNLKGKAVLITGGSRGLGLEIARECGRHGARLILAARDIDELLGAKLALLDEGLRDEDIFVFGCDVKDADQVHRLVEKALDFAGAIDVLINVAGVITVGPALAFTLQNFEETMQTNFFAALKTTLETLPHMIARKQGAIVNIGSIGGKVAFPHLLPYTASKFALVGWSNGLRTEVAPYGIKVTTVNPGILQTGSHVQAYFKGDAEKEYQWFGSSATLPLTATDASVAARKVVNALLLGTPEIEIGLQAIAAARLANLVPSLTAGALSVANALLPDAPASPGARSGPLQKGWEFRGSLPELLESRSEAKIRAHNQSQPLTEVAASL